MDKFLVMNFEEPYSKTGAPIVILNQGPDKILHFLIDTGANLNILDIGSIEGLKINPNLSSHYIVRGCENIPIYGHRAMIQLAIGNEYKFELDFCITERPDMTPGCAEKLGYKIDGVLGTPFLEKYGYIIDFTTHEAYTREIKEYETK